MMFHREVSIFVSGESIRQEDWAIVQQASSKKEEKEEKEEEDETCWEITWAPLMYGIVWYK